MNYYIIGTSIPSRCIWTSGNSLAINEAPEDDLTNTVAYFYQWLNDLEDKKYANFNEKFEIKSWKKKIMAIMQNHVNCTGITTLFVLYERILDTDFDSTNNKTLDDAFSAMTIYNVSCHLTQNKYIRSVGGTNECFSQYVFHVWVCNLFVIVVPRISLI